MKAVRFFYLTRWALRNDPTLGYVMAALLLVTLDAHLIFRAYKRILFERISMTLIASIDLTT